MQTSGCCPAKGTPNRAHFFAASRPSNHHPVYPTPPRLYFPGPPSPTIEFRTYMFIMFPGCSSSRRGTHANDRARASGSSLSSTKERSAHGLAGKFTGPTPCMGGLHVAPRSGFHCQSCVGWGRRAVSKNVGQRLIEVLRRKMLTVAFGTSARLFYDRPDSGSGTLPIRIRQCGGR